MVHSYSGHEDIDMLGTCTGSGVAACGTPAVAVSPGSGVEVTVVPRSYLSVKSPVKVQV